MRIKLNCLSCGHPMELGDAYEDYEGEIRCWGCQAVLEVALQEGKLRSMRQGPRTPSPSVERADPTTVPLVQEAH